MVRLEDIIDKVSRYYNGPPEAFDVIRKAYVFSAKVHEGQTRLSGEEYLSHPIEVANILTELKMDPQSVATGLLHDTVEDTHTTIEKIEEVFGHKISTLVDGLTKLGRVSFEDKEEREAENFRKMILAMASDIRVVLIKLADRLHNMRTLEVLSAEKRLLIARETSEIYAPLANRLGVGWIKNELEDLAFKYLEPDKYKWLEENVAKQREEKEKYIAKVKEIIESKLHEGGIEGFVEGRVKHRYSIHAKMVEQDLDFDDIHDMLAFRVIVDSVRDCYSVLGIIHSTWKPVPGRFKDYIAIPKQNMYQSLHTTVFGPYGERMETQIRTEEMHRVAEYGIAAHWKYKEGKLEEKTEKSFAWLSQLLEWQKDLKDSSEFLETLKVDLFPDEVFVFTPQGDVKEFPVGATPVDFAYAIHTDVGHRCRSSKVNGKLVTLKHRLRNGDVVQIINDEDSAPSEEWLSFVVTSRAKTRIRHWLKANERQKCAELGREICKKSFAKYELDFYAMLESGELEMVATEEFSLNGVESLLLNVGYGKLPVNELLAKVLPTDKLESVSDVRPSRFRRVLEKFKGGSRQRMPKDGVLVRGVEDAMVSLARCCSPLPGSDIGGVIKHGQGIFIHTFGCPNLIGIEDDRRVDVEWDRSSEVSRPVTIEVVCKNRRGLLADMSRAISDAHANVTGADIKTTSENKAVCTFDVGIKDIDQLRTIIKSLRSIKRVLRVQRVDIEKASGAGRKIASL